MTKHRGVGQGKRVALLVLLLLPFAAGLNVLLGGGRVFGAYDRPVFAGAMLLLAVGWKVIAPTDEQMEQWRSPLWARGRRSK